MKTARIPIRAVISCSLNLTQQLTLERHHRAKVMLDSLLSIQCYFVLQASVRLRNATNMPSYPFVLGLSLTLVCQHNIAIGFSLQSGPQLFFQLGVELRVIENFDAAQPDRLHEQ